MPKAFELIPCPQLEGRIDEQASTDAFVEYMGGKERADAIYRIWSDSYPGAGTFWNPKVSKKDVFKRKAREAGYQPHEIEAFMKISRV